MMRFLRYVLPLLALWMSGSCASPEQSLDSIWNSPPPEARLRAYWWWLNGNVTKSAITRDLEQMKAKGFGGALICDAGGADQRGNAKVPAGPVFASPEWRELYKHALHEAARLGLEISLNIQSGWNLGGPMITAEDSVKKLVWSETILRGPTKGTVGLIKPKTTVPYYKDLFVIACKRRPVGAPERKPLLNLRVKTLQDKPKFTGADAWFLANSSPETALLFAEEPESPGEEDCHLSEVIVLTDRMSPQGILSWQAPAGDWMVYRFGCTLGDSHEISTASDTWTGYALDVLDEGALKKYWDAVVEPLIADAGPLAGKTLRYLHTDSWEVDVFNWTPRFVEEFRTRRGYDPIPYLPIFAGMIIESRSFSNRFLADFRKTLGDLAVDRHFRPMSQWAARHGLGIHPEAGGPHFTPIDAQRCLGLTDIPTAEFWAESPMHRITDTTRFFVKQPASASHIHGRGIVAAEAFTTVGPHWQERLWENLKPAFDHAACEGVNRLFWHAFVCSPEEMGVPGQQYFAGTHLNPNVTWWDYSQAFFGYLNRCQALLQRGRFVADALVYYGDHVPNFAQSRSSDPAKLGKGYDYDVIEEEALLSRVEVRDGRFVLPDGMSYRLLVLPSYPEFSLRVLRKLKEFVAAGGSIAGPKPKQASGLTLYPESEKEFSELVEELWTKPQQGNFIQASSNGREILAAASVTPDFEVLDEKVPQSLGYLHRKDGDTEIYFVANRAKSAVNVRMAFRVAGRQPEFWDPVSGIRSPARDWSFEGGRTVLPFDFAPCGSVFVIFRESVVGTPPSGGSNTVSCEAFQELNEPWTVRFDPKWGGPESVTFDQLLSWTRRTENGIRFYSGSATYSQLFHIDSTYVPKDGSPLYLDLGDVRELASVKLNGKYLGILWTPPFRVEIGDAVQAGENLLEVTVVNFWANRIIGDHVQIQGRHYTRTNIRQLTKDSKLMESGLLGPVKLLHKPLPVEPSAEQKNDNPDAARK